MRHLWTAALVIGSLSTCAAPIDPEPGDAMWEPIRVCDPGVTSGFEHIELSAEPPALHPCDCGDPRCLAAWIDRHLGCGVCVHVRCNGGMAGACVPCGTVLGAPSCLLPPAQDNLPR